MGQPAARVGDPHVCPMVTGVVPHVGGPISTPGSPNVLIGGMPAATVGSMCVCVGPPDVIVKGSAGVFIGGKPAARMGDMTAHGGSIVMGCPTVLIGETGNASVTAATTDATATSAMPKKPTDISEIDKIDSKTLEKYLDILKVQENSVMKGYKNGKFYPADAPEKGGGSDIGYGHKLNDKEVYKEGITELEATDLLKSDVSANLDKTKKLIDEKYPGKWDTLDDNTKLMLTDYNFNTKSGLKGFPKLTESAVSNDWIGVNEQYKRKWTNSAGEIQELKGRNDAIYENFIKPNIVSDDDNNI